MKQALIFVLVISLFNVSHAAELPWQDLPKVGQAKLKYAFWNIYRAKLYGHQNAIENRERFALKLTYLRSFKSRQLVKETQKQMSTLGEASEEQIAAWGTQLLDIWPNIRKGDSLTLFVDENQHANFYFNQAYLGTITDSGFSYAFSDIWLSTKTSRPELRLALLGSPEVIGR